MTDEKGLDTIHTPWRRLGTAMADPATSSELQKHREVYGKLDPFAVAPFITRYGEPLSPEGHRLAALLHRARHGRLPITWDIRIRLVQFLGSPGPRYYDAALHRQKLIELLEHYDRQIKPKRQRRTLRFLPP
jgi:hypothetical protein